MTDAETPGVPFGFGSGVEKFFSRKISVTDPCRVHQKFRMSVFLFTYFLPIRKLLNAATKRKTFSPRAEGKDEFPQGAQTHGG